MLNKLGSFLRQHHLVQPGDKVVCAVSGGADSVALLFALYLLADKLEISLSAAHFNHHLRGEESDRDEAFVRAFCGRYEIPLFVGHGEIVAGKKGLEAAAREARYAFFRTLPGKIATAHTADDNAETFLLHVIRGTGLKGLGAIAPVNGMFIRPMLGITRQEVMEFIASYYLDYVSDSSNDTDLFLRNRIRHHVMPLLKQENPRIAQNLSMMALRLREDEAVLAKLSQTEALPGVEELRAMDAPFRRRRLASFLEESGVPEPEAEHIALAEGLVFSDKPSAQANFPGNVTIARNYDRLEKAETRGALPAQVLPCPGVVELPECGLKIVCRQAQTLSDKSDCFTVVPDGQIVIRCRWAGDAIRVSGGKKSVKKLFIDSKLPASRRLLTPIIADGTGILGVYGYGANKDRLAQDLPAVEICFEEVSSAES